MVADPRLADPPLFPTESRRGRGVFRLKVPRTREDSTPWLRELRRERLVAPHIVPSWNLFGGWLREIACSPPLREPGLLRADDQFLEPRVLVEVGGPGRSPPRSCRGSGLEFSHRPPGLVDRLVHIRRGCGVGVRDHDSSETLPADVAGSLAFRPAARTAGCTQGYPCGQRFTVIASMSRSASKPPGPRMRASARGFPLEARERGCEQLCGPALLLCSGSPGGRGCAASARVQVGAVWCATDIDLLGLSHRVVVRAGHVISRVPSFANGRQSRRATEV